MAVPARRLRGRLFDDPIVFPFTERSQDPVDNSRLLFAAQR